MPTAGPPAPALGETSLAPEHRPDPQRGKALAINRQKGFCLLCHAAPIPEERFQGDIAPDLAGVGDRYSQAQLRARLVDPRIFNPHSLMPAYFRTEHLKQVGSAWQGRTLLSAQEIEDVVAWLESLRNAPAGEGRR